MGKGLGFWAVLRGKDPSPSSFLFKLNSFVAERGRFCGLSVAAEGVEFLFLLSGGRGNFVFMGLGRSGSLRVPLLSVIGHYKCVLCGLGAIHELGVPQRGVEALVRWGAVVGDACVLGRGVWGRGLSSRVGEVVLGSSSPPPSVRQLSLRLCCRSDEPHRYG